jgi:hypothetical protein
LKIIRVRDADAVILKSDSPEGTGPGAGACASSTGQIVIEAPGIQICINGVGDLRNNRVVSVKTHDRIMSARVAAAAKSAIANTANNFILLSPIQRCHLRLVDFFYVCVKSLMTRSLWQPFFLLFFAKN